MKQQDTNSDVPKCYSELAQAFTMTQQQMDSVEQKIRERAKQNRSLLESSGIAASSSHPILLRKRFLIPTAACLALTIGSVLAVSFAMKQHDDMTINESRIEIEEQTQTVTMTCTELTEITTAPESHTTVVTDETESSGTQTSTTSTARTTTGLVNRSASDAVSDARSVTTSLGGVSNETTVTGSAGTIPTQSTTASRTTTQLTTTQRVTETQTTSVTTVTDVETTPQPQYPFRITNGDYTARPGDIVTVELYFTGEMQFDLLQMRLQVEHPEGLPDAVFIENEQGKYAESDLNSALERAGYAASVPPAFSRSTSGTMVSMVFAGLEAYQMPEHTMLMRMRIQIPDDAAPGSVYSICPRRGSEISLHHEREEITPMIETGKITIIGN